jgi:hypothetical protein
VGLTRSQCPSASAIRNGSCESCQIRSRSAVRSATWRASSLVKCRSTSVAREVAMPDVILSASLAPAYSARLIPEPPISAGRSFIFGKPSFMGSLVSA